MDYRVAEEQMDKVVSVMRQMRLVTELLVGNDHADSHFRPEPGDLLAFFVASTESLKSVVDEVQKRDREANTYEIEPSDMVDMMFLCAGMGDHVSKGASERIASKLVGVSRGRADMEIVLRAWQTVCMKVSTKTAAHNDGSTQQTGRKTLIKTAQTDGAVTA